MSLYLETCLDDISWDDFVGRSLQRSVFCQSAFLRSLHADVVTMLVTQNGTPLAGVVLLLQDGVPLKSPYPFTMYQGVLFDESISGMPYHRRSKLILELEEFLLAELRGRFETVSFCMHHTVEDLRGFQWFNYHDPNAGQCQLELRYTGILELKNITTPDELLSQIRTVRRQEYRKCKADGFIVERSTDIDVLDDLHHRTFVRQGMERNELEGRLLRSITAVALETGMGELLLCKTPSGDVASATLFLYDDRYGYYLFAANDPTYRKTGCGSFLMVENILRCMEKGLLGVDFVGINSPHRGDFKTSFNARPVPYHILTWQRPVTLSPEI